MKNLFAQAHKMTREIVNTYGDVDYKVQFGFCLAYLQKEEEEKMQMTQLKGTEKQVAYAEKCREKMIAKMEKEVKEQQARISRLPEGNAKASRVQKVEILTKAFEKFLETETNAGNIIHWSQFGILAVLENQKYI
ncbi:hypothetical protein [Geosporobacter ferrireducens]|uniref:hypothetical protein n=1 Tax=Geosporobacter ferrireducens TaxID=1424294 RepID=UPI00139C2CD8|nr:hypothetical protein [Geosporobacter ferrireducens]MTI53800.1 hypothetical protein [Geosporobacter ferrireducens]